MKRIGIVMIAVTGLAMTQLSLAKELTLETDSQKLSYAFGYEMGHNFKQEGIEIDANILMQGLTTSLSGEQPVLAEDQLKAALVNFQKQMMAKRAEVFAQQSKQNGEAGEQFLAKNKTESGVVVLPSGLQYKVMEPGAGASPAANDSVTVDYEGSNINGQVFDSSYKRGKSATFHVNEVIPAWTGALQKMKVGATWMIYAPPSLAYGKTGIGGPIGPEQTLVFKIHLISINHEELAKGVPAKPTK